MRCRSLLFPLMFFCCFTAAAPAQETESPGSDIGAARVNAAAVETLRAMTPGEIETLDAFLEKALTLYYDRKFALAFPIFRELSGKVETMDIMFWLGTSAAAVGETDLAVEKFRAMLAIDRDLYRVRLELAGVYFAVGRNRQARGELERVLAANPPKGVQANIRRMLTAIDEQTRRLTWHLRLSTGWMWDDNISSGPDAGRYTFSGGSSFTPSATAAKLSDQASVTSLAASLLFDPGQKQGFMWNSAVTAYVRSYTDFGEFNYQIVDVATGPWWAHRRGVVKFPVGVAYSEYGSDRLSHTLHVDPSYEYYFHPMVSMKGTYRYKSEKYDDPVRAARFDNIAQAIELSPTLYLDNRRTMISAPVGYDAFAAENDALAYTAPRAGVNLFTRFATQTELYLGYQWTRRDYDGAQGFPYAGLERDDTRHQYTAVLSQVMFKHFNLSYALNHTDNDANLDLNDWDRTTHTLSVGCQY
jgi:tetratricopeptide (TPR) repeat protein